MMRLVLGAATVQHASCALELDIYSFLHPSSQSSSVDFPTTVQGTRHQNFNQL
jgi:hypothetical protein